MKNKTTKLLQTSASTIALLGFACTLSAQTVIENFESYADSIALNADIASGGITANTTVTLGTTSGIGGSQSFEFQTNVGADPYYGVAVFDIADFSLAGYDNITLDITFLGGSNENFQVKLQDEFGGDIAVGTQIGTQTISSSGTFDTYTIGVSDSSDTVGRVTFVYGGDNFGTTTVAIDNITGIAAVPEPAAASAIFGISALLIGIIRRRKLQ